MSKTQEMLSFDNHFVIYKMMVRMKKTTKLKQKKKPKKATKKAQKSKAKPVSKSAQKTKSEIRLAPLDDRVVVRPQSLEEKKTSFGLIIPDSASKEKPETGKVLAVGPGKHDEDGNRIKMSVKVGDMVLFSKYAPDEIKLDGEDLIILREDQILGIIS